jgi:hypothetical protein
VQGTRSLPSDACGKLDLTVHTERPCEEIQQQFLHHQIDLELVDPFRVAVWPEPGGGNAALIVIHHVAADGVLARNMIDELFDDRVVENVTEGVMSGDSAPDPLDLEDVDWWIRDLENRLGDTGLPVPENRSGADAEQAFAVTDDVSLRDALELLDRRRPHGRVACGLAAWAMVLAHRLGRDRLVIGVPFAMDSRRGLAANMLPVAIDLGGRTVFEVLESIGGQIADGIEHRRSSFGSILNGMPGEHSHIRPPVDAVLTIDDLFREHDSGVHIRWEPTRFSSFQASVVLPQTVTCSSFGIEAELGFLDGEEATSMLARWMYVMRILVDASEA